MWQYNARTTYVHGRATKSLFCATKIFSHTIKQLLHQCHSPPERLSHSAGEKHVKKSGASATKCAVLGTKVAVLGMCNENDSSNSRRRICAVMHMIGFTMEPRGRAELGVAQDSDKSLTGLEL